jgi:hypothetical protein
VVKSFGSSKDPQEIETMHKEAQLFASSTKYTPFLRINNENDIELLNVKHYCRFATTIFAG